MSRSSGNSGCNPLGMGFRFHPTNEELISFLTNKVLGRDWSVQHIAKLDDICKHEPMDLPEFLGGEAGDREWYFFYPPAYKYKNSKRIDRTTGAGYWKVTGKTSKIRSRNGTVILKRTLVFYEGSVRKHNGKRTSWVIHEYELNSTLPKQKEWLFLCKLKKKKDDKVDASSSNVSQPSNYLPSVVEEDNPNAIISLDDLGDLDMPAAEHLAPCLQSQPQMRTNEGQPSHDTPTVAMEINANAIISLDDLGDMNELGAGQIDNVVSHLQPQMRSIFEENYHSLLSELQPQMQGAQQQQPSSSSSWSSTLSNDSSCCSDTAQNHYYFGILNGDDEGGFWSSFPSLGEGSNYS